MFIIVEIPPNEKIWLRLRSATFPKAQAGYLMDISALFDRAFDVFDPFPSFREGLPPTLQASWGVTVQPIVLSALVE
jgi:hypothetical protein